MHQAVKALWWSVDTAVKVAPSTLAIYQPENLKAFRGPIYFFRNAQAKALVQ